MTGIETADMMLSMRSGSLMRATPPWARISAGTRSRAITATAPASSAILACSGVTTSMITPPLSASATPRFIRAVPVCASTTVLAWGFDTAKPFTQKLETGPTVPAYAERGLPKGPLRAYFSRPLSDPVPRAPPVRHSLDAYGTPIRPCVFRRCDETSEAPVHVRGSAFAGNRQIRFGDLEVLRTGRRSRQAEIPHPPSAP